MFEHPADEPVLELTDEQSRKLLSNTRHGRIAFQWNDQLELFPVNYVLDGDRLIIRTAGGVKKDAFAAGVPVTFETDGVLADEAWSVIAYGTGELIEDAAHSGVTPWVPTMKDFYVAVNFTKLSGRHFIFGAQPEPGDKPFTYTPGQHTQQPPASPDTKRLSR